MDPFRQQDEIGCTAERGRSIYHREQGRVEKCEKAWEFLVEAMQGQSVGEEVHVVGLVEGA